MAKRKTKHAGKSGMARLWPTTVEKLKIIEAQQRWTRVTAIDELCDFYMQAHGIESLGRNGHTNDESSSSEG